ncbi:MAG: NAD(+) diphosphatase [Natronospirillum sp.]|uniref:NAD(+) diphosphatase n=1 Tax=Natronospirillum sp. TaxID=2812955 RepID=UPI0025D085FD|nr:NAD(+) diphosphatase [Natronospirillum sp.]MCH8551184.1 NAD(+) diphosphatase [Natronospirillum sp.]
MLYDLAGQGWDLTPGPEIPPPAARLVLVHEGELLSVQPGIWETLDQTDLPAGLLKGGAPIALGKISGRDWYALEWPAAHSLPANCHRVGLREVLAQSESAFAVASRAVQMMTWRRQHRYCGQCGRPTEAGRGEHFRFCEPCELRFYPRINPCIIVLVVRGDEVLLAQGTRHRTSGWYSTLAGFMEPGESAEQAVHREVAEEVGVTLGRLRYMNSQTWPFPHQLMLGFIAEYESGDICLDPSEIARASWFPIDALPSHPPVHSISGWLISQYVKERRG